MQINIQDIWAHPTRRKHKKYVDGVFQAISKKSALLDQLLTKYGRRLATAIPPRLREIIDFVEGLKAGVSDKVFSDFLDECKLVFNYTEFSRKSEKPWNAYALCKTSKYLMCPYCQQAPAFTIHRTEDNKGHRPTLDHYYPKGEYPYLALSLYNLIPSCYSCNSSLKGKMDFYLDQHLHPFEHQEMVRYEWDIPGYINLREKAIAAGSDLTSPGVKIRIISILDPLHAATLRSLNTFLVTERLEMSELILAPFFEILLTFTPERLAEINKKIFKDSHLQLTEETALQFSRQNYKNEWFGRLKADLLDAAWTFHGNGTNSSPTS